MPPVDIALIGDTYTITNKIEEGAAPFFEFDDLQYLDGANIDKSSTCPITYVQDNTVNYDLLTMVGVVSKKYKIVLKDSYKISPGTYDVSITGAATGNTNTKTVMFRLTLLENCKVEAFNQVTLSTFNDS